MSQLSHANQIFHSFLFGAIQNKHKRFAFLIFNYFPNQLLFVLMTKESPN